MLQVLTNRRAVTDEIMDSPHVDHAAHLEALAGLKRINGASRAADRMAQPILQLAARKQLKSISMIDVACGGGDVPIAIAKLLKECGMQVELTLADRSPTAVRQACAAAEAAGIHCRGVELDALAATPNLSADVITNSLFLHHVPQPSQVVELLHRLGSMAKHMVVVSDLRRSPLGWAIAWAGCRVLSRSHIVHHDGPVSVRAAWTLKEMSEFAVQAGMNGVRIERCAPWRMLLVWEKP